MMKNPFPHSERCGKCRVSFAWVLAMALGLGVITELSAQVVVVPNVNATNDGDSSITQPDGPTVVHRMHIFDASQFGALSGPSFLTRIAFRPDTIPGPTGPRTATLRIYVSTTSISVAGMSTTFSENIGTNNTLVFDGTVPLSTQDLPGPGNTRQFDIAFPFATPFLYDPAAGNLLLEIQTSGGSGAALRWDAVTVDSAVRTVLAPGSPTASTGNFADSPVHQFTFEAPPPLSFAGWAASFGLSGVAAAADADPDDDGMPNGAEYILAGNPTVPATSGRPTVTTSAGNMVITFSRDDASETTDVTLTVETGTNLMTWPTVFTIGPNTAASSPGVSIAENGSALDTITVTIAPGTDTQVFARLKATVAK